MTLDIVLSNRFRKDLYHAPSGELFFFLFLIIPVFYRLQEERQAALLNLPLLPSLVNKLFSCPLHTYMARQL